ncbi:MAG: SOS response-associated peptidase [Bradyrhizobium sp.]|uniref:SOS response-associated peptidase n=1 Tax=Bradyrhizobium sp. TaxID=376 RepID=UPI001DCD7DF1|nr:SOS response-associated peptidase [Bradyrhizobium sp.]MBV9565504.1 SOS response-associated peptidase [Bradyrhizobium sp.]
MCGRFVITSPPEALRQIFGFVEQPNFPPRHNIAPTQPVPVIILENGVRHFRLMRWGFVPSWVKDPRKITLLINARSETVVEKPAFKNAIRRRRCLIPADGYYEWQAGADGKRPYFIHRRDGKPFGLAGVAESWMGPNGEELDTVAVVTAPASADLSVLHHRVPVTLMPVDFERWLDCREDDVAPVLHLLVGPEEGEFVWHAVSRRVNSANNDDAQLLLPISDEERAAEEAPKPAKRTAAKKPPPPSSDDGQGSLF